MTLKLWEGFETQHFTNRLLSPVCPPTRLQLFEMHALDRAIFLFYI